MKPEAQRIAIAEACGYKYCIVRNAPGKHCWYLQNNYHLSGETNPGCSWSDKIEVADKPHGDEEVDYSLVPHYLNDLNAMHEAEKLITKRQQARQYMDNLSNIVRQISWPQSIEEAQMLYLSAAAAQRAEAFLRTIGKWVEE